MRPSCRLLSRCAALRARRRAPEPKNAPCWSAAMAGEVHPVPFRTRKLSPPAPMVLRSQSVGEQDAADQQGAFSCRETSGAREGPFLRSRLLLPGIVPIWCARPRQHPSLTSRTQPPPAPLGARPARTPSLRARCVFDLWSRRQSRRDPCARGRGCVICFLAPR